MGQGGGYRPECEGAEQRLAYTPQGSAVGCGAFKAFKMRLQGLLWTKRLGVLLRNTGHSLGQDTVSISRGNRLDSLSRALLEARRHSSCRKQPETVAVEMLECLTTQHWVPWSQGPASPAFDTPALQEASVGLPSLPSVGLGLWC